MDSATHAMAGAVVAEVLLRVRARRGAGEPTPAFARAAWAVSIVGNNIPDADQLYTGITAAPLGYLLHHRGHTHTLALAPAMALLSYGIVALWARRRGHVFSRGERGWLSALALLGPLGHIAFDACNDYGTHPFWPVDKAWRYGDTIFIVEPLLWMCALPALIAATTSRVGRGLWAALLVLGVLLAWGAVWARWVPWVSAAALMLLTGASIVVARRTSPGARVAYALIASAVVIAVFAVASRGASSELRAALARARPDWETLDVARTPVPATPLCWQAIAVQRSRDGRRYALRVADVSAHGGLVGASACTRPRGETTAPLAPGGLRERAVIVTGEIEASIDDLRERSDRCDVAAFLRWSRVPFFAPAADGAFVVGDLRYDTSPAVEWAEMRVGREAGRCPAAVPHWRPPRLDLLERL